MPFLLPFYETTVESNCLKMLLKMVVLGSRYKDRYFPEAQGIWSDKD